MKADQNRVATRFAPEMRFELRPTPPAPFRASLESDFELLKNRLLDEHLAGNDRPELTVPLRRAANEAAALAWVTPYPLLVFPALFEEKTAAAVRQIRRQARIYANSREIAVVV